jgi:hypothetical protein
MALVGFLAKRTRQALPTEVHGLFCSSTFRLAVRRGSAFCRQCCDIKEDNAILFRSFGSCKHYQHWRMGYFVVRSFAWELDIAAHSLGNVVT